MNEKQTFKEDINFLEWPTWVVKEKTKSKQIIIEKPNGRYELISPLGLPTHFDRLILYSLLYSLEADSLEVKTSRYKIAKHIDRKITASHQYTRILNSLKKWQSLSINFSGIFYEGDKHTMRFFSIIDDVIFTEETKELYIKFNQQYIKQIRESKFYKYIDFSIYKKLSTSAGARLYEVLVKNFKDRDTWSIKFHNIAEKLTLEKRTGNSNYFPSDVIAILKSALHEINCKTELKINFNYDSKTKLCSFEKVDVIEQTTLLSIYQVSPIVDMLMSFDISLDKAKAIANKFPEEKIKHKIGLLKQSSQAINNIAGWILKALEEDWDTIAYDKQKDELKLRDNRERKRNEEDAAKKKLEELKALHNQYKINIAYEKYTRLGDTEKNDIDEQFKSYYKHQCNITGAQLPEETFRNGFLIKNFLSEKEQDFNVWAKTRKDEESFVAPKINLRIA